MSITNLKGLTVRELEDFAISIGERKFRGKQLFDWLYTKEASSFSKMSSLSKPLREKLASMVSIGALKLVTAKRSENDGTVKFLFELDDGNRIESVLIPSVKEFESIGARSREEERRLTLCVSTQVGCPIDCRFCATASMGFQRNLLPWEILDQLLQVKKISGQHITNVVYMGMGEPLMNYENVMKSIEIITTGIGIASRHITISTVGWVPGIVRMADENRRVKLAISLHSLDQQLRFTLMPVARKFKLTRLLDAVYYYHQKVKRRVTFEYILFAGLNDREEDINRLVKLSRRIPCKINLIPFHSIEFIAPTGLSTKLRSASMGKIEKFAQRLRDAHVSVFIRGSAGEDIGAACGQLAVLLPNYYDRTTKSNINQSSTTTFQTI